MDHRLARADLAAEVRAVTEALIERRTLTGEKALAATRVGLREKWGIADDQP